MIYDKPKHKIIELEKNYDYAKELQLGINLVADKSQIYIVIALFRWNLYVGWMQEI